MMRPLSLLVLVVMLPACGNLFEPAAAVVNGEKIAIAEVSSALERLENTPEFKNIADPEEADELRRDFEQGYLAALIRRAVFRPEAARIGIKVSDEQLQASMDEIKAQYPNEQEFEKALEEQGLTEGLVREFVRDREIEEQLRAHVATQALPTDDDIAAYYRENREEFEVTEAQHILVEGRQLARRISRNLRGAPSDEVPQLFARLARRFSTDEPTSNNGGRLPTDAEFGPAFDKALADLDIGEVSNPVQTEFGFHVIRATNRRIQSLAEARDEISQELSRSVQADAWQEWVVDAYEAADVEVNPRFGVLDLESQQIRDPDPRDLPGAEVPTPTAATPAPATT